MQKSFLHPTLVDELDEFKERPSDTPVLSNTSFFTTFSKQSTYSNNSNLSKGRRKQRRRERAAQQFASTTRAQRIKKTNGRLLAQEHDTLTAILPLKLSRKSFVAAATLETLQLIKFPVDSVFDRISGRNRSHLWTSQSQFNTVLSVVMEELAQEPVGVSRI